jgi:hypothetical protein
MFMTVTFDSSDKALVAGWNWAVSQALAYVRHGDPVGDWFEASLPGRNGFCMRDTAHQAAGAQVLGLHGEVKNMLLRFAENIAASRDWCTFWEISGDNVPVAVDYNNDQDFWYNLPANFDVLDCCWRQYQWTGDADYISDPVFLDFYDRTVNDYVQHWDADGDGILEQPPSGRRGIASYEETISDLRVGGDLIAAQIGGYEAYAQIQRINGNPALAQTFEQKAAALRVIYQDRWWKADEATFFSVQRQNGQFSDKFNPNVNNVALYFGAVNDIERVQSVIDGLVKAFPTTNVEAQSYYPEVAYHYGRTAEANAMLRVLIDPKLPRREYPEVSYAVLGTIVTSLMGIASDAQQRKVTTHARLTAEIPTTSVTGLPMLANQITVAHEGNIASEFANEQGEPLLWEAHFSGASEHLIVDGEARRATQGMSQSGQPESWVTILAVAGKRHRIYLP